MNSMSLPETSGGVFKTRGSESVISHFSVSTSHIFNTVTIEASSSAIKPSSTTTVSSNVITVPAIGTTYTQLSNIDIFGVITPSSYPPGKKYVAIIYILCTLLLALLYTTEIQTPSSSYEHTAVVTGSVGGVMSIIIICQSIVIIILLRKIRNHGTYRFVDIAKYL